MANQWFKFYGGEFLSDPKILQLTAEERSCWLTLLCLANQSDRGIVKFLSEKQLFALSGITKDIPNLLKKFEELEMIHNCNGTVTIKNWEKRQMSEGYSRVQAFRKRQSNANDNDRKKERKNRKKEEIELPIWLNKKAWEEWVRHREEIKKPLTPGAIKLSLKKLEENQKDHVQMIKNSILGRWTGLFPINNNSNKQNVSYQKRVDTETEEREKKENEKTNDKLRILSEQSKSLADKMSV